MKLNNAEGQLLCSLLWSIRNSCKLELEGKSGKPAPDAMRAKYLADCIALADKVTQGYQEAATLSDLARQAAKSPLS